MAIYGNLLFFQPVLVTEAYFGKTETLLEIEKQIGIIREKALDKYSDINRSPEVLKLNRLFEKQFGMDVFSLHIEKNNTINAYTIPVATRFDIAFNEVLAKKVVASQSEGFRFKPGNNLCIICNIYLGLIGNKDFTDAEILAVILHELGHNFADAIYKDIEVANKEMARIRYNYFILMAIYNAIMTLGLGIPSAIKAYRDNLNKVQKKKESKTRQRKISGFISGIKATCTDFVDFVDEVWYRISGQYRSVELYKKDADKQKVPSKVKKSPNRYNEVIADKFAGIYGYGPEQASALLKMHKVPSKAEKFITGISFIDGDKINKEYKEIMKDIYKYDEHPHVIQRINEEIKTLQYELEKSDLDPKLVEAMKEQIKELEKIRDQAIKVIKTAREDERMEAEFYKYVNDKDPNAIDDKIEEEINKAFDEFLED